MRITKCGLGGLQGFSGETDGANKKVRELFTSPQCRFRLFNAAVSVGQLVWFSCFAALLG